MNKKLTLSVLAGFFTLCMPVTINAQDNPPPAEQPAPVRHRDQSLRVFELGARYLPTSANLPVVDANGNEIAASWNFSNGYGIMAGVNLTPSLGFLAEVSYLEINQKYTDGGAQNEANVAYINVPVMLALSTNKKARLNIKGEAGPQFGFNTKAELKTTGQNRVESTLDVRQADIGLAYGAGVELALNNRHTIRLDLGFRGYFAFFDMKSTQAPSGAVNVAASASRQTYGGVVGLTFCMF